jgi:ketosteroid isomerase-like protein
MGNVLMGEVEGREPARDPQDLERLLVTRQHAGDVDGIVALYEPDAIVDVGEGRVLKGIEAIRAYFAEVVASGHKYTVGEQQAARICGDLALTSTRVPAGEVTAEVARRQADGTWLWVIDVFTIA